MTIVTARHFAKKYNWQEIDYQDNIKMISFIKNGCRINIYLTKQTVVTCLKHPKKGKTQLFRKRLSVEEIEAVFVNPRLHTCGGYYKK